mgnify:CR=1 FL=1
MKKLLAIIISAVLCLSLSACIYDDTPTKEQGEQSAETSIESKEDTFGLNETAVFDKLKFTASELKESAGSDFFTPEAGKVFVGIKFTIENVSNEEQSVSTLLLFDGYVDDIKCDYSLSAACVFDEGTLDGSIAPGKKLVGWYSLEVPSDWSNIELNVQSTWLSNSVARFVFTK